jgi:putative membrane-bound dehydrogenase-like protein
MMRMRVLLILPLLTLTMIAWPAPAQKATERPPHGQDTVPGPALTPAEAIKKMKVPEGFQVELVAAEPGIVNPVAMTFDERGRIWITESLEYPRASAGPGRDRIKVLESTRGDGQYDKITVFAEGLNIPSGIAVGHGGVWVANSPDILYFREGPDGKAAGKPEVVVTGFGRTDTHELPNSLTWGPDGWLYGFSGVFNYSHVKHRGKDYVFTCAMFRIHPRTKDFELFCEGTSNPWGIAFDTEGSAFVSACVIDHLWHLVQTGYYHRQGGPYPPYTWKIDSIVKHRHQKAAYCGIHFFDSDAYPPEYREKLYMGNIHGNCINVDELTRDGSTYFGKPRPDFLTANDPWFMPVAQRTGPDGCLYILDWYDRYHCYQDAQRDPQGIDRVNGRLYRVRYKDTPRAGRFDLGKESDDELIRRLHSPNLFFRDLAQRLLSERNDPLTRARLEKLVLNDHEPRKARMHALWALVGAEVLEPVFHQQLLGHADSTVRAWGVRAAGNMGKVTDALRERIVALASDPSPDVKLQVAIAARRIEGLDALPALAQVLANAGNDRLLPPIVWQNLHPLLEERGEAFIHALQKIDFKRAPALAHFLPRLVERTLAARQMNGEVISRLLSWLRRVEPATCMTCMDMVARRSVSGEISEERRNALRANLTPMLKNMLEDQGISPEAVLLLAALRDPSGLYGASTVFNNTRLGNSDLRTRALKALVATGDPSVLDGVARVLGDRNPKMVVFKGEVLATIGRLDDPKVAEIVLNHYPLMEPELQPKAIELLTQRAGWSKQVLGAISKKAIPASALNINQVRKLLSSKDPDLVKQVKAHWGTIREGRSPEREKIVAEMRALITSKRGDAMAGWKVFRTVCAQCHKIHGEGVEVGPDVTSNGRNDFDQLLSNVFDPSLVIGAGYQATTVTTTRGQVLTGLVVEDNAQRVVLKTQGGKLETIPRAEVDTIAVSQVSLMPEDLEKQLRPQEIIDLFAFLTLDRPPGDPQAKLIPGTPR